MTSESDSDSTFDPRRKLCPDGSCVGLIGDDGKCTVCGTGDAGAMDSLLPSPNASDALAEPDIEHDAPSHDELAENLPSDFDPNRRLCSDGDCIGVLGEDKRCRLCGKPAAT